MQSSAPASSTPTKPFPTCDYCTHPGSYMRRDMTGERHYACGKHTADMRQTVDDCNEAFAYRSLCHSCKTTGQAHPADHAFVAPPFSESEEKWFKHPLGSAA